jgi:hypothetical protein
MALVVVLCRVGLSLENPVGTNPVGSGTIPPTAYKSGLIPSANPIDTTGNLVVTGNVAGGMYFRGVVPYSGATNFSAPASSLAHTSGGIDSFLRSTAGSQDFEQRGGITPYYSPTWTVATTTPGGKVVSTPQAGNSYGIESLSGAGLPSEQTGYNQRGYVSRAVNRPLSRGQQELEKLIEADVAPRRAEALGGVPISEAQSQEQFWQQLRVPMEHPGFTAGVQGQITPTAEPNVATLLGLSARQAKQPAPVPEGTLQQFGSALEPGQGLDIFEQMKIQLGKLIVDVNLPAGEVGQVSASTTEANKPAATGISKASVPASGTTGFAEAYKSFAAVSDDKFNRHIRTAEGYMKHGRFYRAADAYTLAIVYKPTDPLGYAGKSQALFAAGEYMSSALFLARALEVFPEYAKLRIDLVGMIGDKDALENRILEAKEWRDISKSAELEFLLSYVYYQMDRLEFARRAIESAAKKMPDSQTIAAMKKAIDERTANP